MSGPGRNDPCPCGSGAKFKRCCGSPTRSGYGEDDREAALAELGSFCKLPEFASDRDVALALFWGDRLRALGKEQRDELRDSVQVANNFFFFLCADVRLDGDDTLIDELLRRRGSSLPIRQRNYLRDLGASHLGVHEVRAIDPGGEITLGNLWTDEGEVLVDGSTLPVGVVVRRGDVLVARVLRAPSGAYVLEDDLYLYPADFRDPVLRQLQQDRRAAVKDGSELSPAAFLKRVSFRFNGLWMEMRGKAEREPKPPPSRTATRYPYLSAHLPDLLDDGDLSDRIPPRPRQLALYLGRIVAGATAAGEPGRDVAPTGVDCRRRPGRRRCDGQVLARLGEDHDGLEWACSSCGDAGTISSWRGSAFDLSVRPPIVEEEGDGLVHRDLQLSAEDHRRLLRLSHLTARAVALLVAAIQEEGVAFLDGTRREYSELARCIVHELVLGKPSAVMVERLLALHSGLTWAAHERPDPTPARDLYEVLEQDTRRPNDERLASGPRPAPAATALDAADAPAAYDGGLVLHVRLRHIEPPIWRRVEMPAAMSLADLHHVLIVAMGWDDTHLHVFRHGERAFALPGESGDLLGEDSRAVRVGELLRRVDDRLLWEYDLGDGWCHELRVESRCPEPPERPRLLAGERACPPEDCGGPPGHARLLAILSDPHHPEHQDLRAWAGPFDPEAFDAQTRDRELARLLEPRGRMVRGPWGK